MLDDALVGQVLDGLGTSARSVRATLEHRMLASMDDIDVETLFSLGIDVATVLEVLNPPFEEEPDWRGRTLSPEGRDVLVKALVESAGENGGVRVHAGHVLLGLLSSHDPVVAGTLREHGVRMRPTRALVAQWGRRAG